MTEENAREIAQLEQRDTPKKHGEGVLTLFVAEVVGELDLVRGFATRVLRPATVEDVRQLMPEAFEGQP